MLDPLDSVLHWLRETEQRRRNDPVPSTSLVYVLPSGFDTIYWGAGSPARAPYRRGLTPGDRALRTEIERARRRCRKIASYEFRKRDVWPGKQTYEHLYRPGVLFSALCTEGPDWGLPDPAYTETDPTRRMQPVWNGTARRPLLDLAALDRSRWDEQSRGTLYQAGDRWIWVELVFARDLTPDDPGIDDLVREAAQHAQDALRALESMARLPDSALELLALPPIGSAGPHLETMLVVDAPSAGLARWSQDNWSILQEVVSVEEQSFTHIWIEEIESIFERRSKIEQPPGMGAGFNPKARETRWHERARHEADARFAGCSSCHCLPNTLALAALPPTAYRSWVRRPGSFSLPWSTLLHASCFLLLREPERFLNAEEREVLTRARNWLHETADTEGFWVDRYAGGLDVPDDWPPTWGVDSGDDPDEEPWDPRPTGTDVLGWYTPYQRSISLNLAAIASVALRLGSPGLSLSYWQRFAALLMKVLFHEMHHAAEEVALTELGAARGAPGKLFAAHLHEYAKSGGPKMPNEALANGDALDRVAWVLRRQVLASAGREPEGRLCSHLTAYASNQLAADARLGHDVLLYLEQLVERAPGTYGLGNQFRRVVPRTSTGPAAMWFPLVPDHGGSLLPVDGSCYWQGLGNWLSLLTHGEQTPEAGAALAVAFQRGRSRFERCHRVGQAHLYLSQRRSPPAERTEHPLVVLLRSCAAMNKRLPWNPR